MRRWGCGSTSNLAQRLVEGWKSKMEMIIPTQKILLKLNELRDFPGGPVVKNLLCNPEDIGSIPGQGTKIDMPQSN